MLALAQRGDQPVQARVADGDVRLDERQPSNHQQLALERRQRRLVRADALVQLRDVGVLVGQLRDPVPPEPRLAQSGGLDSRGVQPQLVGQQLDVLDLDLVQPDLDDAVVAGPGVLIERVDLNP